MSQQLRILQIEDSEDDAALILREVRKYGQEIDALRVETAADLQTALRDDWDLILSDYALPHFSGLDALELLKTAERDIPFIIVSGAIGEETAVLLMRAGACDYVSKEKLARIVPVIKRELADAEIRRQSKVAEAALQKARHEEAASRSKIVNIIQSVPDGLLVCDEQNRVILINHAAERLLGLSAQQTLQLPIHEVFADSSLAEQLKVVTAPNAPDTWKVSLELPIKGSKYPRTIQARTSAMKDHEGNASGTVTLLRDITREQELDRMKSEFISTVAHELNTPLTTIIGYVDLLLSSETFGDFTPLEQRGFLLEIQAKGLVLAGLVEGLLDIGRIEAGQELLLVKTPCDLPALMLDTLNHFQAQTPGHTLVLELSQQLWPELLLDRARIAEVLLCLLSNAVKYSPQEATIRLSGRLDQAEVVCTVADSGIGMTTEETRKVFDPFYRIDTSNTAVHGLGLGLSLAKQIVEAHHGRIWLESTPGAGTRVHFALPLKR